MAVPDGYADVLRQEFPDDCSDMLGQEFQNATVIEAAPTNIWLHEEPQAWLYEEQQAHWGGVCAVTASDDWIRVAKQEVHRDGVGTVKAAPILSKMP